MTDTATSRIAVIGAGSVGGSLGRGWAARGHRVCFGVRDPHDPRHDGLRSVATVDSVTAAAAGADVVVLAVPATAVFDAVAAARLRAGQVLVDATNAVRTPLPDGFDTLGEAVAARLPEGVSFVKGFDTIGAEHLDGSRTWTPPPFLPIAGDPDGVAVVSALATELGLAPVTLGGRESVQLVEDHARLWIHLAFSAGWGRAFHFVAVRDS